LNDGTIFFFQTVARRFFPASPSLTSSAAAARFKVRRAAGFQHRGCSLAPRLACNAVISWFRGCSSRPSPNLAPAPGSTTTHFYFALMAPWGGFRRSAAFLSSRLAFEGYSERRPIGRGLPAYRLCSDRASSAGVTSLVPVGHLSPRRLPVREWDIPAPRSSCRVPSRCAGRVGSSEQRVPLSCGGGEVKSVPGVY
jgi:hypothetical protein